MTTKIRSILLAVATIVVSAYHEVFAPRPKLVGFANTYDEHVAVHMESLTKLTDDAITTRHLLFKKGSDSAHIAICGAEDVPMGTVDNEDVDEEGRVTLLLLGRGTTKKMVASEAMATTGVRVFAAAGGKIALTGKVCVGRLATVAGADGDIVEVIDQLPETGPMRLIAAGIHTWAGGAATTDSIAITGLLATDVVIATLAARASTETLVMVANDGGNDQIDLTLSANGTNGTTKIHYAVYRAD